ncbi:hypothetical protein LAZ67_11003346 [Cordylochernes scorpioides]|uniref:Reverse transcriptase domain-containing protein n=1 Tax=Cordylochernes scorpioides TaxID=51811 RepID=A0ABY6L247_9ARAC|nr:hypothetical protein LAZ67_11003346 [Cordylochernes scorpioides]
MNPDLDYYMKMIRHKSLALARWRKHLEFNKICELHNFIPPSLRIKDPVGNYYSRMAIDDIHIKLLRARTKGCYSNIRFLSKTVKELICIVSQHIPARNMADLLVGITRDIKTQDSILNVRHLNKLSFWSKKYKVHLSPQNQQQSILNFSKFVPSPDQINILSKGLKHRYPSKLDKISLIAGIESSISSLTLQDKHSIRNHVISVLNRSTYTPTNSFNTNQITRTLTKNNNIVITRSDKGSRTVIMNTTDYVSKMNQILHNSEVFTLATAEDQTISNSIYKKELRILCRNKLITTDELRNFLSNLHGQAYIYGLPKVHKINIPLRPIVAFHLSSTAPLAQFLAKIIIPILKDGDVSTSISSTPKFLNNIQHLPVIPNTLMISFDVINLYPSLPPPPHYRMHHRIPTDAWQSKGTPMSSPLSSPLSEIVMRKIDNSITDHFPVDILTWFRQNKPNLHQDERKAINLLRENKDIIITPSDKGRNTVIMDTTEYNSKIEQLLQDKEIYEELSKDPLPNITKEFNKKLNKIIRTHKLNKKSFEYFKAEEKTLPNFYGLPKIHKPNIPLRPIVSYAGSPLYPLTKFLSSVISPFQKQLPHTVPNPIVAVETIKTIQISNDSRMVSFDIESLYTSIPHDEALLALQSFLEIHPEIVLPLSKEALIDLIKLCLDNSYFSFKDRFFRQIKGLPMGNPISSELANIFMNEIDEQIINSKQYKIILWLRYIDDIFCLTEIDIDSFICFLNSLKPFLKFTYEKESNNSLAFLDIQLKRNQYNIGTYIYRKLTHTGNYLNFSSFGPIHNKIAVVKSLSKRIETHHSNRNSETEERNRIFKELINNNYPKRNIEKHFHKQRDIPSNNSRDQSQKRYCSIPYSYGSERIARILKRHNIITTYQSAQNLRQILRHSDTKKIL